MPARCVLAGCSNTRNLKFGIGLHTIPYHGDDRPEARKRGRKWVDFVKMKRAKWEPSESSDVLKGSNSAIATLASTTYKHYINLRKSRCRQLK